MKNIKHARLIKEHNNRARSKHLRARECAVCIYVKSVFMIMVAKTYYEELCFVAICTEARLDL